MSVSWANGYHRVSVENVTGANRTVFRNRSYCRNRTKIRRTRTADMIKIRRIRRYGKSGLVVATRVYIYCETYIIIYALHVTLTINRYDVPYSR